MQISQRIKQMSWGVLLIVVLAGCSLPADDTSATTAALSELPSTTTPYEFDFPTEPTILNYATASNTADITDALSTYGDNVEILTTANIDDKSFDIDLRGHGHIRLRVGTGVTAQFGNVLLDYSSKNIEIVGGRFAGVSVDEPPSCTVGSAMDIAVSGAEIVSGDTTALDLRHVQRFLLVDSSVTSPRYAVWVGNSVGGGTGCESTDVGIFDSDLLSYHDSGVTNSPEATVRLVSVRRSAVERNRLSNTAASASVMKHNYRVHGTSSFNYAAANQLVNSGVMIGTCTTSSCGDDDELYDQTFDANVFCHVTPSLFQMHSTQVIDAVVTNNDVYTDVPEFSSGFPYQGSVLPPSWKVDYNNVFAYSGCPF